MRQSQLFTKTSKETPQDEPSLNAQLLIKGGFVNKLGAGIYTFLPLGQRVHQKICNIIREEINAIDGQEIQMPALIPKNNWETTKRWETFDALFKLKGGDDKEYGLGATHEEVITPTVGQYILSYKDLPRAVYQIQTKFRNELRAKSGLLRGREFSMKDLYSFHANEEDLNEYYKTVQKTYFKIFERIGLLEKTYLTFASGGAFSKYSHEFQTLSQSGEDIIYICDNCQLAINKEIIEEQKECIHCGNKNLRAEKSIEVGNIFKLGDRFSHPFKTQYKDSEGNLKDVVMGCYGIGPSRLMGTIAEIYNDASGIIWPRSVSPFTVHILALKNEETKVKEKADALYALLQENKIDVLYDDRLSVSTGEKFADADLIGCSFRVVVSEKNIDKNKIEIKQRSNDEVYFLTNEELIKELLG